MLRSVKDKKIGNKVGQKTSHGNADLMPTKGKGGESRTGPGARDSDLTEVH